MSSDKMTFREFTETVKENIKDYLPESYRDAQVTTGQFQKLNGSYLGLQVRQEGQEAVPTVNLERYYEAYSRGEPGLGQLDTALSGIAEDVQGSLGLETAWLLDYRQVKDNLFIRVNDAQENADALKNLPHQETDGLAVSYHIAMEGPRGIEASVPVTYSLMQHYGISEEQLHEDALQSAVSINPPVFLSMREMMSRMTGIDAEDLGPAVPGPELMVLSNEQALFGAGSLFYPGMLDTARDQMGGSDYFVLPSSVHEVLLVADDGTMDRKELESMVQEINETAVADQDRLSDHVYHYDAKDHLLEKASTFEHRMDEKERQAEKAAMETAAEAPPEAAAEAPLGKAAGASLEKAEETDPGRAHGNLPEGRAVDAHLPENGFREPVPSDLSAGASDREERKDAGREGRRQEKDAPFHEKAGRAAPAKKERKSVLARLSEKKDKVSHMPKKDVQNRSKTTQIGE